MQALRATPATLSVTYPADPGAVVVTVTRLDGTALYTGASATVAGAVAAYALTPADTATLDTLTATFTSAGQGDQTASVEIVGALLFTVAEARTFDKGQLANASKYPDAAIEQARERIGARFERIAAVSFIPRYKVVTLDEHDRTTLPLPDLRILRVRSVEWRSRGATTWQAYDAGQLADVQADVRTGVLRREMSFFTWTGAYQNVRVGYEYGYAQPPEPIREAALWALLGTLIPTDLGDRSTSVSNEAGTFRLATPGYGRNSWYGLPRVDALLTDYREAQDLVG